MTREHPKKTMPRRAPVKPLMEMSWRSCAILPHAMMSWQYSCSWPPAPTSRNLRRALRSYSRISIRLSIDQRAPRHAPVAHRAIVVSIAGGVAGPSCLLHSSGSSRWQPFPSTIHVAVVPDVVSTQSDSASLLSGILPGLLLRDRSGERRNPAMRSGRNREPDRRFSVRDISSASRSRSAPSSHRFPGVAARHGALAARTLGFSPQAQCWLKRICNGGYSDATALPCSAA